MQKVETLPLKTLKMFRNWIGRKLCIACTTLIWKAVSSMYFLGAKMQVHKCTVTTGEAKVWVVLSQTIIFLSCYKTRAFYVCPPFTMITTASFTTEGNSFTTNNTGVFGLSEFFCWFCLQSGRENFLGQGEVACLRFAWGTEGTKFESWLSYTPVDTNLCKLQ